MGFVYGTPSCEKYNMQTGMFENGEPSFFCYFYVGLMVISLAAQMVSILSDADDKLKAFIAAVFYGWFVHIMYVHCKNCQAWRGFFVVLALQIFLQMVLFFV